MKLLDAVVEMGRLEGDTNSCYVLYSESAQAVLGCDYQSHLQPDDKRYWTGEHVWLSSSDAKHKSIEAAKLEFALWWLRENCPVAFKAKDWKLTLNNEGDTEEPNRLPSRQRLA